MNLLEDFYTKPLLVVFYVLGIVGIYKSLLAFAIYKICKPFGFYIPFCRRSIGRRFLTLAYYGPPLLASILSWDPDPPLPAPIAIGIV